MQVMQTLRRAETLYAREPAVLEGDLVMTWGEFARRTYKLAGALQELGIGDDDKVAVLMLNSHRYLELFYSTFAAGGVIVPLNIRLAPPELIFEIN